MRNLSFDFYCCNKYNKNKSIFREERYRKMGKEEKLAFESYFKTYYQQAFKYTVKKVSDVQAAEDLVMDAFVSCHQKFDEFDPERAKFATWLYVILNNKIKNYYRDKKEYESLDDYPELITGEENELASAVYIGDMRKVLADALQQLNETQRKIVILKYFKGKDSNEIALECGISPGNVRVQLSRIMNRLKKYFDEQNVKWEL